MANIVEEDGIRIERLELGPYGTNAYILFCRRTGKSVLVDAPARADEILAQLKGSDPTYILMTHSHMDHTGALAEVKSALNVPIAAHRDDAGNLPLKPDLLLNDGDEISSGDMRVKVLHTPGHTPGSLCFLIGSYLIAGDTLFPNGPGKTGSRDNFRRIVESLQNKIFTLPEDTRVFPGHGSSTVVGKEKQAFEAFSDGGLDPNLYGDVLWS